MKFVNIGFKDTQKYFYAIKILTISYSIKDQRFLLLIGINVLIQDISRSRYSREYHGQNLYNLTLLFT